MSENIEYGKFWDRVGAYLLDSILVGIVVFGLNYLNITQFKSFLFYLPVAIVGILYKPFMESYYGGTLGKMALNLQVTDLNYNKIDFERSLLRSLIVITPSLIYIPLYYLTFNNPQITNINGFMKFSMAIDAAYPTTRLIGHFFTLVFLTDLVVLITEGNKRQRSLKDFIAKTYVIKLRDKTYKSF